MQVTIVNVHVKQEHIQDFIAATQKNHDASVKEEGNLRFDVLQSSDDASRFVLYEAYINPDAAVAHKDTAHYLAWRETVADWMASPREGLAFDGLYPLFD